MLEVIDLFREQGTRDELGIGTVRDGIADLLFPGMTTIQTRARYFLFIPWMFLELERKKTRAADIAATSRRFETNLIEALKRTGEKDGVIGIEAGRNLKRLPSSIYWIGLGSWGIRTFPGSLDQYFRSLDRFYVLNDRSPCTDDGDLISPRPRNWRRGIPPVPGDMEREASFGLTSEEALFLRERVVAKHPRTLLTLLIDCGKSWEPVRFPWEHPQLPGFPERIQRILRHGKFLSIVMHGAAYLYNLLVAERAGQDNLVQEYEVDMNSWSDEIARAEAELMEWDRTDFWRLIDESPAQTGRSTRAFMNSWIDLTLATRPRVGLRNAGRARNLIVDRERALKGPRARIESARARELWSGAAGLAPLEYRWFRAQRIILDIIEGLERD
jgi:hypothetical protein